MRVRCTLILVALLGVIVAPRRCIAAPLEQAPAQRRSLSLQVTERRSFGSSGRRIARAARRVRRAKAAAEARRLREANKKKQEGNTAAGASIAIGGNDKDKKKKRACFPARALVNVNGLPTRMDALRVRDRVSTGVHGKSSPVFMFSHAESSGRFEFVRLDTHVGALTASPGHLVYTTRRTLPARDVVVGDALPREDGSFASVVAVSRVTEQGLFNPQTLDGDLVIDGFVVSTYTEAVPPAAAGALLAPMRAVFQVLGIDASCGALGKSGMTRRALVAGLGVLEGARGHVS